MIIVTVLPSRPNACAISHAIAPPPVTIKLSGTFSSLKIFSFVSTSTFSIPGNDGTSGRFLAHVGAGVFTDGFESGDTSAWSFATGG